MRAGGKDRHRGAQSARRSARRRPVRSARARHPASRPMSRGWVAGPAPRAAAGSRLALRAPPRASWPAVSRLGQQAVEDVEVVLDEIHLCAQGLLLLLAKRSHGLEPRRDERVQRLAPAVVAVLVAGELLELFPVPPQIAALRLEKRTIPRGGRLRLGRLDRREEWPREWRRERSREGRRERWPERRAEGRREW